MSASFYQIVHILGVLLVFFALGGATFHALSGSRDKVAAHKLAGITHGVALVLVLISGFGLLAKLNYGFDLWVWLKLTIWLVIGGAVALVRRMPQYAKLFWFALPLLGVVAYYLANFKPGV